MKEKSIVQLRKKELTNGGYSLYLDYTYKGTRHKEYLKMYLNQGTDQRSKLINKRTYEAAKLIQAKKVIELQNGKAGIEPSSDITMSDYFRQNIDARAAYNAHHTTLISNTAYQYWTEAISSDKKLKDISVDDIRAFIDYLKSKGLGQNTVQVYFSKVNTVLNDALRKGMIITNPANHLDLLERPKRKATERSFLTFDELKAFAQAPCPKEIYKQMFMFSCYTGLRYSDLIKVTWQMIDDGFIHMSMTKTKEQINIPLSKSALNWIPRKHGKPNECLFDCQPSILDYSIRRMAKAIGLNKKVSIHTARHTFATLELTYGADLYTVSKLLGHTNISTTQIYAKIVDKKKEEAVNLLPEI